MERLYSILEIMKIKDIVRFHSETTTPIPDVVYHLYSLPSFDNNQTREELLGQDIQSNKFTVPNRCILFNKLNVRFKRIWRIDSDEDYKIASTEFLPLIIDENKVDFDYCFYLLASPAITDYLCGQNANTSGSHKRIDPTNFFNIGIKLPPLAQQYEIGKLLSSLDTKIKLNRQINQNLEAMAKQLYDYWFVQFDFPNEEGKPYKSSGGAMVWNEKLKREIPEGWNVMSINEICTSCRGVSYGKDDLLSNSNGVLVLRGNNIENNHIVYDSNVAFVPYDFVSEEQHIKEGDIIMTMSSGSKAHVGKCAMFHKDSEHTFGAFLSKFTPKKELRYMTFLFLTSEYFKSLITAFCNGTGINNLTNQTFDDVLLVLPDEKKTRLFESKVNGLFAMIGNNEENERILIKQRDELLPLLMNGQASVNSDLSAH